MLMNRNSGVNRAVQNRIDWPRSDTYHRPMDIPEERSPPQPLAVATALLVSTRPKQWTKNLIVYFAMFFSLEEAWELGQASSFLPVLGKTTVAFALFSAITGAVYLVNDIFDVEQDRRHPTKRRRPIASGRVSVPMAWAMVFGLVALGLGLSFALAPLFGWVCVGYLALMLSYTIILKRLVLLDVFSISAGFVLRAVAGAAVLDVPISPWLYICTGLGALLIALAKRRSELAAAGEAAAGQRGTLEIYTTHLLDQFIAIVAPSTLLAYTLYTFTAPNLPDNHAMMLTIPFVVYGLFRYIYLVHTRNLGENPEDILITDAPLLVSIGLWLVTAAAILVVFRG